MCTLARLPQKCAVVTGVARVEPRALDGTSEALLEVVAPGTGGCMDAATAAFSAATAATLPALRFARGSRGPCNGLLRVCCPGGGGSLLASIVASIASGRGLVLLTVLAPNW